MDNEIYGKYRIECSQTTNGYIVRIFNTNRTSWKAAVSIKAYRFSTAQKRQEYIDEFKSDVSKRNQYMQDRKTARVSFRNPAKVGDILYSSWGYDQTNIDFYQVKKVAGKTVTIQRIHSKTTETAGFMSEMVTAQKDSFVSSEPELKKIVRQASEGYQVSIASYASAWLWDGKPKNETSYA